MAGGRNCRRCWFHLRDHPVNSRVLNFSGLAAKAQDVSQRLGMAFYPKRTDSWRQKTIFDPVGGHDMHNEPIRSDNELHEIIETKLTSMMIDLENGDWSTTEVALAVRDVLKAKWLDEIEALQTAREDMPGNFVSDGNEG